MWAVRNIGPGLEPINPLHQAWIGTIPFHFDFRNLYEQYMYYGCYETEVLGFCRRVVKSGDIVIDVGSNIGYMVAHFAMMAGTSGQVHAFEPVPFIFQRLTLLAEAAESVGYSLRANPCCLGDREGTVQILVPQANGNIGRNTIVSGFLLPGDIIETVTAPMITLDSYFAQEQLDPEKISLIKIDVEGAEPLVIQGMRNFLSGGTRPVIICEINPQVMEKISITPQTFFGEMDGFGYQLFLLTWKGFSPVDWRQVRKGENVVWIPR